MKASLDIESDKNQQNVHSCSIESFPQEFLDSELNTQKNIADPVEMVLYSDYHDFILVNDSNRVEVPEEILHSRQQHQLDETIANIPEPNTVNSKLSAKILRPILHEWFGDSPSEKKEGTFRLCLQNPNGLPATNHSPKVHRLARMMKAHNINFLGMPESRVNVYSRELSPITTLFQSYHPGGAVHHTNTFAYHPSPTTHQRGGVTTFVDAANTKRLNNVQVDPLGRWQRVSFLTAKNAFIVYIVYKVNPKNKGSHKAAWDHQRFQLLDKGIHTLPEDQVVIDIKKAIGKDIDNNNSVIIMGDANEHITDSPAPLHDALADIGLVNVLQHRFGDILPPTHQYGNEAIDHVWATPNLLIHFRSIGIAPLRHITGSDHRAIILDLDCSEIFDPANAPMASYNRRVLKSNNAKRCIQYVEEVQTQYLDQKVPSRLKRLHQLCKDKINNSEEICNLCDSLDRQLYDIQMGAENKLPAVHDDPWSTDFQTALDKVHTTQNEFHTSLAEYKTNPVETKRQELVKSIQYMREAEHELQVNKEGAMEYRKKTRIENAQYWHNQRKYDNLSSSLRVVYNIERQRDRAHRIKNVLKPRRTSSLSYILIPARENYPPHLQHKYKDPKTIWDRIEVATGKDITNWVTVTDRSELENILLGWQCLHFQQASDTPFANAEWEEIISTASSEQDIIDEHTKEYDSLDEASKLFLKEIFDDKKSTEELLIDIHPEDLYTFIHKKKESTSTSPSNRHLGHWKAILNEPIFMALFTVIKCCIEMQHIPPRWKTTITALIEKESGSPKIHRLRTIHIVEPEVQFITHYYWSKGFLQFCETQESLLTDAQYGGRKGRWSKSAILKQQLTWDVLRMQNKPACTHLADARANFDRNISHLVSKALTQRQFPPEIAAYYRKFLKSQCFLIRTGYGVSRGSYTHSMLNQIFGDCQGLGWSAINQIAISTVIDNVCKRHGSPFLLQDCFRKIEFTSGVNYFIDDRTSNTMLEPNEELSELIPKAQTYERLQQEVLNSAGGALAPNKCRVWVLARSYGDLAINYYTEKKFPGTIALRSSSAFPYRDIPRLDAKTAFMYLGALISPKYTAKDQYDNLLNKIEQWSRSVNQSSFDIDMIWQSYDTTLEKQLEYPLCASNLSKQQCETLTGKIRKTLAQRQHYSSKLPTDLTHGPIELCALAVPNLYDTQGKEKINLIKHHMYQGSHKHDTVADLIRISFCDHCLWIGSFENFFHREYNTYSFLLAQVTYLRIIWEYLDSIDSYLDITDFPSYTLPRLNDRYLMDILLEHKVSKNQCLQFNRVRIDLQLLSLSDIVYIDSFTEIHEGILKGTNTHRSSVLSWPDPELLPDKWSIVFRDIIKDVFVPYLQSNPLGPWISTSSHQQMNASRISEDYIRICNDIYSKNLTDSYSKVRSATAKEMEVENYVEVRSIYTHDRIIVVNEPISIPFEDILTPLDLQQPLPLIPEWMEAVWGHRKINTREMTYLAYKIQSPFTLMTDGGMPNGKIYGTYSYILADSKGTIFFANYGVAPGHPNQRSSTRYEGFGQLAGISLINFLETYGKSIGFKPCIHSKRTYSCDNMSICKARQYLPGDKRILTSPHSDVLIQLCHEFSLSDNHPKYVKWTQGHPEQRKAFNEFTMLEYLNYTADEWCHHVENIYENTSWNPPTIAIFLPQQQMSILSPNRRILTAKPKNLAYDKQSRSVQKLLCTRFGFTTQTLNLVNMRAASSVMKHMTQSKRIRFFKVFHERWITNYQMHKIGSHPTGSCPICHQHTETQKHVLCCQTQVARSYRDDADETFIARLNTIGTPPALVNFFTAVMDTFNIDAPTTFLLQEIPTSYKPILNKILLDQQRIGWYNFARGMIASTWEDLIKHHFSFYEKPPSKPTKWSEYLISALVTRCFRIWNSRCSEQSGEDSAYLQSIRVKANKDLIYYSNGDNITMLGDFAEILQHDKFDTATKDDCLTWLFKLRHALKTTAQAVRKRNRQRLQQILRLRKRKRRIRFFPTSKISTPRPVDPINNLWFDLKFITQLQSVSRPSHPKRPERKPNIPD